MDDLRGWLEEFFAGRSALYGISDITGLHPLSREFPSALSILLPYFPEFRIYDEESYHRLLEETHSKMKDIVSGLSEFLRSSHGGIEHLVVPQGGQDPVTLMALFPHKLAAVRAGLGWIGKSSLLVTMEHGPRVYLATVLIDSDIQQDAGRKGPALEDGCGECTACVNACPYLCIKNVSWAPGVSREELLDIYLCNERREEAVTSMAMGRKDECGLCLLACPYGGGQC